MINACIRTYSQSTHQIAAYLQQSSGGDNRHPSEVFIDFSQKLVGSELIVLGGRIFTRKEVVQFDNDMCDVRIIPKYSGGQLFSKGDVEDFTRDMVDWARAGEEDGGRGMCASAQWQEDCRELNEAQEDYRELLESVFVNRQVRLSGRLSLLLNALCSKIAAKQMWRIYR